MSDRLILVQVTGTILKSLYAELLAMNKVIKLFNAHSMVNTEF